MLILKIKDRVNGAFRAEIIGNNTMLTHPSFQVSIIDKMSEAHIESIIAYLIVPGEGLLVAKLVKISNSFK